MAAELLTADRARLLLAIVEAQTFTGAAEALGITSSAVSRQVMRIEQDTGCRIFTRDTHSLSLTREGEALILFARAMSDISEGARRFFMQPRLQGSLRVGITEDMTRSCLTRVLALFAAQFPNFGFEVTCDLSARLYLGLEEHRLDIVLGSHLASERRGELLRKLPLSWIGRAGTSLPLPDPIPLVLTLSPDGKREAALQALRDAGRPWRVLLESASLAAVEAAVEAGLGIAALGAGTERRDMADLGSEAGLPRLPDQAFSLDWRRPDQDWGGGMEAFVDVIRNVVLQIETPQRRPVS